MGYFSRFSPFRAIRDLRRFLGTRQPHELYFLFAAIAITAFFIFAIATDSRYRPAYQPNIIYVQQWPANRSETQILAQQKIDEAARLKRVAAEQKDAAERQAGYKRLDDKLKRWGI